MRSANDIVDFHAHLLPGADHGSDSIETSLFQIRLAREFGVSRIIATPHFYPAVHKVDSFLNKRNSAYEKLASLGLEVDIRLGAEVLICNGIEKLPGLERLFVNGTNTLLLELPFSDFQTEYCDSVYNLVTDGVEVVLAHADRYSEENIERLIELGAKIQLNVDSLSGIFISKHLYRWLESGAVVAFGSDIHGEDKKAYKKFAKAISKNRCFIDAVKSESDRIFNSSKKI